MKAFFDGMDGLYITRFMRFVEGPLAILVGLWCLVDPVGFTASLIPLPLSEAVAASPVLAVVARMAANGMILAGSLKLTLLAPTMSREAQWIFIRLEVLVKALHVLISAQIIATFGLGGATSWINYALGGGQLIALCICVGVESRRRSADLSVSEPDRQAA